MFASPIKMGRDAWYEVELKNHFSNLKIQI
jgi:hypothetical protein